MNHDKLSVIIETLFETTDESIKQHLSKVQKIIDAQQKIKIRTELEGGTFTPSQKSIKEIQKVFDNIAKEVSDKMGSAFGFDDRVLGKLKNVTSEILKTYGTLNTPEAKNKIFDSIYESIRKFESVLNPVHEDYKAFIKTVSQSKINMPAFGADFEQIRKQFPIGVVSTKKGINMDLVYQELSGMFPQFLPDDNVISTAEDQFMKVFEVLQKGREMLRNSQISDDEINMIFGGKQAIREAIDGIISQIPNITQELAINTTVELPKVELKAEDDNIADMIRDELRAIKKLQDELNELPTNISLEEDFQNEYNHLTKFKEKLIELSELKEQYSISGTAELSDRETAALENIAEAYDLISNRMERRVEQFAEKFGGVLTNEFEINVNDSNINIDSDSIADAGKQAGEELTSAVENTIAKVELKQRDSLFSDEGLDTANQRIEEIRNNIDELAKIKITNFVDDDSNEKVKSAILTYRDELGRTVTETMAWKSAQEEVNGQIKETRTFQTVATDYSDDIGKRAERTTQALKQQAELQEKINNLSSGNISGADGTALQGLSHQLSLIDTNGENAKSQIKEIEVAYKNLYSEIKRGNLVENRTGLQLFTDSTDENVKRYIASLKAVGEEQVKIQSSKITYAQDGSEIRHISALVDEGGGKWRNYQYAVDGVKGSTRELKGAVKEVNLTTEEFANALASLMVASGVKKAFDEIKQSIIDCVQASISFEDSLVELRKKSSFSVSELSQFRNELLALSAEIPLDLNELTRISAVLAQTGVLEDNILSATKVMAQMGVATSMSAEEASINLARLAAITGLCQTEFDRLGSTLSKLSNNFAANESETTMMAKRLGSAASMAGITAAELIGLSNAMVSVGIRAEMGQNKYWPFIAKVA